MRWRDIKRGKKKASKEKIIKILDLNFATIADKSKAFLTDSFMILMPIMYIVFYLVMGSRDAFREEMLDGWIYIITPHMIITTILWSIKGQTPGMRAFNLEIVDISSNKKPSIIVSFLRYILTAISFFSIIGFLIGFFRNDRRALHDLLSGTYIKKI